MINDLANHMAARFLTWELPDGFNPDGGISFEKIGSAGTAYEFRRRPTGTNLFSYEQAEMMIRHLLEGCKAGIAASPVVTEAERDVIAERRRQIDVEGWTADRDDNEHDDGDLAAAASCYALSAADTLNPYSQGDGVDVDCLPEWWPFDRDWWKPDRDNARRDLVKAGALILAEIERLDRAAIAAAKEPTK